MSFGLNLFRLIEALDRWISSKTINGTTPIQSNNTNDDININKINTNEENVQTTPKITKLEELTPAFRPIVADIIEYLTNQGWEPYINQGLRTLEQQKENVRRGNSQTLNSKHLPQPPDRLSHAADIVDKRYEWEISHIHRYWYDYGNYVVNLSPCKDQITWGGIWSHQDRWAIFKSAYETKNSKLITWFFDSAHIELKK